MLYKYKILKLHIFIKLDEIAAVIQQPNQICILNRDLENTADLVHSKRLQNN